MRAVRLLLAYAPEDADASRDIQKVLVLPRRRGEIQFIDQQLSVLAGADRKAVLHEALAAADVVLLLLSNNFLASDECFALLEQALALRATNHLPIVPLLFRHCDWQAVPTLADLQALPRNGGFLDQQALYDQALTEMGKELVNLTDRLRPSLPPLS